MIMSVRRKAYETSVYYTMCQNTNKVVVQYYLNLLTQFINSLTY